MTRKEAFKFITLRAIGNFLVLFSLYGVFATFGPAFYFEVQFRIIEARGINYTIADTSSPDQTNVVSADGPSFGDVLAGSKEQILVPKDTNFSIVIPKIGASSRVKANVDPNNEEEFRRELLTGVAHAKGSVFPGLPGNTYLFAHSTDNWWNVGRYNAVFYLLKELKPGDDIVVFFENRRYNYVVKGSFITDPEDTSLLRESQKPGGPQQLILQTCWPPGTAWKRLFVIAVPKTQ